MKRAFVIILITVGFGQAALFGQSTGEAVSDVKLPLKRVSLFSSGVGYFEHTGAIMGNASVKFSFSRNALNDALKSLIVNDGEAGSPQVNYLSETTLQRTLRSLKIDLSGEPGLYAILRSLTGTELVIRLTSAYAAEPVRGRIVAVDTDSDPVSSALSTLTVSTASGIRTIPLTAISGFSFADVSIDSDLRRALDLISSSRMAQTREITISLTGRRRREVTVSYVIPTPVWKISYRLDLNQNSPALQSWAIIDNDGDIDWNNVEVSLVSGRPVSFIQALYPPYYTNRPVLPLAGAGFAEAQTHDSGWQESSDYYGLADAESSVNGHMDTVNESAQAKIMMEKRAGAAAPAPLAAQRFALTGGGSVGTAQTQQAGEQFEFTLKKPVTLERQQSTMLPLFDGHISARKLLVFSGQKAFGGAVINPSISAELTNTTGIKLPAGSVTVFDGGIYAGDALLDFVNTAEKRLISYGDDLSVSGSVRTNMTRNISAVRISKGLVTFNRKQVWGRTYTIRNTSNENKRLVIEHPITLNAALTKPSSFSEQTANLYRFETDLRGNQILTFDVTEEMPVSEQIMLTNLSSPSLLAYSTNGELDEKVRAVFREALRLKNAAEEAKHSVSDLETQRAFKISEQERIRANLTAAGNQTLEGKGYLAKLIALDTEITEATSDIEATRVKAYTAQAEYENYIAGLEM